MIYVTNRRISMQQYVKHLFKNLKMNGSPKVDEPLIHLALPKGHMQENIFKLMEEAGVKVRTPACCASRRPSALMCAYYVKSRTGDRLVDI